MSEVLVPGIDIAVARQQAWDKLSEELLRLVSMLQGDRGEYAPEWLGQTILHQENNKNMGRQKHFQRKFVPPFMARTVRSLSALKHGIVIQQRDLYYANSILFPGAKEYQEAVKDVAAALNIHRLAMGIKAVTKGRYIGPVRVDGYPETFDRRERSVDDDIEQKDIIVQTKNACLIVIEKACTKNALVQAGIANSYPGAIIVTTQGMPDNPTRNLVMRILSTSIPSGVLVDWNPSGLLIFCQLADPKTIHIGLNKKLIDQVNSLERGSYSSKWTKKDKELSGALVRNEKFQMCEKIKSELSHMNSAQSTAQIQSIPPTVVVALIKEFIEHVLTSST